MTTIEIRDVSKYYGATCALDNVNLIIRPGKVYGLLGRNGAGKTTLLNLITNRVFPSSGQVCIGGESVVDRDDALAKVFYMSECNLYPPQMRVRDAFSWSKEFYPGFDMGYAHALAEKFGLKPGKRVRELSTGYASIFKAIIALAVNTDIVLYDEPVLGLDANHRDLFYKELIKNYAEHQKTVVISTHIIEEVADVLEEVLIIKDGRLILQRSVDDLLSEAYTVSGETEKVDQYSAGRKCVGSETIGKFKMLTVLEPRRDADHELLLELGLDIGKVELQKLFIGLTN